ncbi:hypothetical protein TVAG_344090 [Trichomonas vaginalis G3]|uniref:Growth arrest-specific protein 8 domain-containing protein n=1 Tax=Trichomonas vaginalis (strain ATCC PRA-98 / G3) TaxID=412133 RepID=A2E7N0_TRIV3|nr:dynein regulatory complex subunit 4 family [Trichomonas vaginalis G3]EAY11315.1 hypothetical protein TVAG_344090 [Trichomonas vaginalis G3]KAI5523757.1 dynein regulatory complex subunit 4 family [Trichomonas vaginalis G3]|eukprot:XP_001323538.1 hypothetical protein [Trichomonas vaginalis G3]
MNESRATISSFFEGDSSISKRSNSSRRSNKSKIPIKIVPKSIRKINSEENSEISQNTVKENDKQLDDIENEENDVEIYEEYKKLQKDIDKLVRYKQLKERELSELKTKSQKEIQIYLKKIEYLSNTFNNPEMNQNKKKISSQSELSEVLSAEKESFLSEIHDTDSDLTKQKKFSKFIDQLEAVYTNNYNTMKYDLEEQKLKAITEAKKNANNAIQETEMQHATEMEQLQNYYQKTTQEQLETIKDLKSKIARLRPQDTQQTQEFDNSEKKKSVLLLEIEKLQKENNELKLKTQDADKLSAELKKVTEVVEELEDEKENELIADEVLSKRFEQLEEERNAMYDQFEAMIKDVHQKAEFRGYILAQKIQKMNEMLDSKERQLQTSIAKGSVGNAMQVKIDQALAEKNSRINQLESQLMNMHNAYEKMTDMYEAKIASFGVDNNAS